MFVSDWFQNSRCVPEGKPLGPTNDCAIPRQSFLLVIPWGAPPRCAFQPGTPRPRRRRSCAGSRSRADRIREGTRVDAERRVDEGQDPVKRSRSMRDGSPYPCKPRFAAMNQRTPRPRRSASDLAKVLEMSAVKERLVMLGAAPSYMGAAGVEEVRARVRGNSCAISGRTSASSRNEGQARSEAAADGLRASATPYHEGSAKRLLPGSRDRGPVRVGRPIPSCNNARSGHGRRSPSGTQPMASTRPW
jgi:hypothetical protein